MLRFCDNLRLVNGLLYRKWIYKEEVRYLQFILPKSFHKRTVMACHDQFGHLRMDKILVLLEERFFWPKMKEHVHTHNRNGDQCLHFKQTPEQAPMYHLELIHMDFLTIGSKMGAAKEINVLAITDCFTKSVQGYITLNKTAKTLAETLYVHISQKGRFVTENVLNTNVRRPKNNPF